MATRISIALGSNEPRACPGRIRAGGYVIDGRGGSSRDEWGSGERFLFQPSVRPRHTNASAAMVLGSPVDLLRAPNTVTDAQAIVRVMHVVYPLRPGGMEHGVVNLVNGLDPARFRSAVCSTKAGGALKERVASAVPIFELRRRDGNDPRLVWDLYRLFRRERPDVVHTHAWGALLEGLIAARLARVPLVVHGEHGTLQLRSYQRWLQRLGWSAVDQVLSVSSRLAERIAEETGFPLERIRTIRNGVDLSRFAGLDRARTRAALGVRPGALVAVTVGRLVPVKDHVMLLDAVARLRGSCASITVLIAGDGPLKEQLGRRTAVLGLDAVVRFLGHRSDVETVLAAADVFVLSSASEGLSNTILEAMAAGLPVVATRVGGADELVQDGLTGRLVRPRSPQELAEAMWSILGDAGIRHAMGSAGRARAESEFSLAGMIGRYETMYDEVAAGKRGSRAAGLGQSEVA